MIKTAISRTQTWSANQLTLGLVLCSGTHGLLFLPFVAGILFMPALTVIIAPLIIASGYGLNIFARAIEAKLGEPRDGDSA